MTIIVLLIIIPMLWIHNNNNIHKKIKKCNQSLSMSYNGLVFTVTKRCSSRAITQKCLKHQLTKIVDSDHTTHNIKLEGVFITQYSMYSSHSSHLIPWSSFYRSDVRFLQTSRERYNWFSQTSRRTDYSIHVPVPLHLLL